MKEKNKHLLKKKRGSITIEASISMMLFTFMMIGILSFINISRAQAAIGTAANQTALEMSQYAYFLRASGIYDLMLGLQDSADTGEDQVTSVVGSFDEALTGLETIYELVGSGGEAAANVNEDNFLETYAYLQSAYQAGAEAAGNTSAAIDALSGQLESICKNPMDTVKALLSLGASGALDDLKSHLIAAPIAKSLCIGHLSSSELTADEYLKSLGVVDGADGLNFKMSTLFNRKSNTDINVIVVYQVKAFPWLTDKLKLTFAQSASTQGWLGDTQKIDTVSGENKGGRLKRLKDKYTGLYGEEAGKLIDLYGDDAARVMKEYGKDGLEVLKVLSNDPDSYADLELVMGNLKSHSKEYIDFVSKYGLDGLLVSCANKGYMNAIADKDPADIARRYEKFGPDGLKISGWKYPPSDDYYEEYKSVFDNPKYYDQENGTTIYPGEKGDKNTKGFLDGKYEEAEIPKKTIITRYSYTEPDEDSGNYFSPSGTPFEERALPPNQKEGYYSAYEVVKPIPCKEGTIAPWFDAPGGGVQYMTDLSFKELIAGGYLKKVEVKHGS